MYEKVATLVLQDGNFISLRVLYKELCWCAAL